MKSRALSPVLLLLLFCSAVLAAPGTDPRIPEPLRAWEGWTLWGQDFRNSPSPFNAPGKKFSLWPSRLALDVTGNGARFDFSATVFDESWVQLPGSAKEWPRNVKCNGSPAPVVEHEGHPSLKLTAGTYRIEGEFSWDKIPQKITLPETTGIIALTLNGKALDNPVWDADGDVWLERNSTVGEADKDFLSLKLSSELEDGIPLCLRTEVELIVSGKSREEVLGGVLPEGWSLASLESAIPVAVDESGLMKAQLRPGKWVIRFSAFRIDNPKEFRFASDPKPAAAEELIAFRSRPDFRTVEIVGSPSVDVSQISFPEQWRDLPVYRWDTATPFQLEERMRGMGLQAPGGLQIVREWWLDEDGKAFTFRDQLSGTNQVIWRLDAASGQDLGSVRSNGVGQLITRSPSNGAAGVEIRSRNLNLVANGRMERKQNISASGWQTDADSLRVGINLPPGWRLFALFGADWVQGDWLTSWTLLDLFLLLIFSLAVGKLWGWRLAILAFIAFGLAYHEPGSPRYVWLWLLVALALLRVVHHGWGRRILLIGKWTVLIALLFILVPFVSRQIQQAIYPQLEQTGQIFQAALSGSIASPASETMVEAPLPERRSNDSPDVFVKSRVRGAAQEKTANLQYDTKARIQTGPGIPDWTWRGISFGWNGPVTAAQEVRPILIPIGVERILSILRVVLILGLVALLLRGNRAVRSSGAALALLALNLFAPAANAEIPNQELLETLRTRLLEPSDAFPNAAAIPRTDLKISGNRIEADITINAAVAVAVPLPGRLPTWAPVSISIDGKPSTALRREDGYLWISVPAGVHEVRIVGVLPDVSDWEWTFLLKPHAVGIEAPEWTFSGVDASGFPDQQVFFTKIQKSSPGEAAYDRQEFSTLASVERRIELGLVWQVHTTVTRLTPGGKAIALSIPLLPGENVLSSSAEIKDGKIDVRLGAQQDSFTWDSELVPTTSLPLSTQRSDSWVESWRLIVSPVWNVDISGLPPIFETGNPDLTPVWHPWPGESVNLSITRPAAIPGATVTVEKAAHEVTLGARQENSALTLTLRCSLGEDFPIGLPEGAEVSSLALNGTPIPARVDGKKLIVPLRPGEQSVRVEWKTNAPLGVRSRAGAVTLPVGSANIETVINVPESRWVLATDGPLRGPAVRFWTVLTFSLIAAWLLGGLASSPLRRYEWALLGIGLTQVPLPAALLVIAWLFFLVWRGRESFLQLPVWGFNLLQVVLIASTALALSVFVAVVAEGLLGNPEMFIAGNASTRSTLRWYQARSSELLPRPGCLSVSIWWFRLLMLAWALWLAASLLRWLRLAWNRFSTGGCFRRSPKTPPAVPTQPAPPAA